MTSSTDLGHRTHTVVESPIGPLTLVARDRVLIGLYMREHRHRPEKSTFGAATDDGFADAIQQLDEYFRGERTGFDLPMTPQGTPFQAKVWQALRGIPYGEKVTYGQLATTIGRPTASRAVGLATGRNPISVVVPCHRVVGSNGKLTGYGGGIERKRLLLEHERQRTQPTLASPILGQATSSR